MIEQETQNNQAKTKFLLAIVYVLILLVVGAVFSVDKDDKSWLAGPILFLSIYLPLQIVGYYKYRQFLNGKGIRTNEFIANWILHQGGRGTISTNAFLDKKNKILGYTLNFFADLLINIIAFLYCAAIIAIAVLFTWGALKLFDKIF